MKSNFISLENLIWKSNFRMTYYQHGDSIALVSMWNLALGISNCANSDQYMYMDLKFPLSPGFVSNSKRHASKPATLHCDSYTRIKNCIRFRNFPFKTSIFFLPVNPLEFYGHYRLRSAALSFNSTEERLFMLKRWFLLGIKSTRLMIKEIDCNLYTCSKISRLSLSFL